MALKDELEKEQRGKEAKTTLPATQRIADTEAEIKAFKVTQDLESIQLGYDNFKVREATISQREDELIEEQETLKKNIGQFELEQKERVAKANQKAEEYNKAYELLMTERAEAKRIMAEAIRIKAESDSIIKSQSERDIIYKEKQEAYTEYTEDALKVISDIIKVLRRQTDDNCLSLSVTLNNHYSLMCGLQYRNLNLSSIADVIAVDCSLITELCEPLQSKDGYSKITNYLLECVDWLENNLLIRQS